MDRRALERFRKNRGAVAGLVIVTAIVLFAVLVPVLSSHSPSTPDFEHGRGPYGTPAGPSSLHWLGTDTIFRDLFVRLAYGGRLSLEVAFVATTIAMGIGTGIGVVSGYFRGARVRLDVLLDVLGALLAASGAAMLMAGSSITGWRLLGGGAWSMAAAFALRGVVAVLTIAHGVGAREAVDMVLTVAIGFAVANGRAAGDHRFALFVVAAALASNLLLRTERERPHPRVDFDDVVMRAVDVLLSFPLLLLLMALSAAVDRTTEATLFLVLGLTAWTGTARVIRAKTLQLRELEFVTASRALGQSTPSILLRHVLPNVVGVAIVLATNSVATMIVAEAALSFLGLSIPPPAASWGRMLDDGRPYATLAPWLLVAPAIAILLAVLGFNLLGEGLRDAFDPKDA